MPGVGSGIACICGDRSMDCRVGPEISNVVQEFLVVQSRTRRCRFRSRRCRYRARRCRSSTRGCRSSTRRCRSSTRGCRSRARRCRSRNRLSERLVSFTLTCDILKPAVVGRSSILTQYAAVYSGVGHGKHAWPEARLLDKYLPYNIFTCRWQTIPE